MIKEGAKAPAFTMNDQDGKPVKLEHFRGKHVVLYFYPKDLTSGCTVEACDFRDEHAALKKKGVVVLGVSPDNEKLHQKFIAKHQLGITLLADVEKAVMPKYGAWGEKVLYGKKSEGVLRSTVLIDPDGKVAHHWPKVTAKGHAAQVLAKLRELQTEA